MKNYVPYTVHAPIKHKAWWTLTIWSQYNEPNEFFNP